VETVFKTVTVGAVAARPGGHGGVPRSSSNLLLYGDVSAAAGASVNPEPTVAVQSQSQYPIRHQQVPEDAILVRQPSRQLVNANTGSSRVKMRINPQKIARKAFMVFSGSTQSR